MVSVIAIGGDKLSRGLTLEGLSVSYYLRASRMYDTLMQMGRWFGYRPGYLDLCRLYTTDELQLWYRDITVANEELLAKFDEMAAVGSTPTVRALCAEKSGRPDGHRAREDARMARSMQLDVLRRASSRRPTFSRPRRGTSGPTSDSVKRFIDGTRYMTVAASRSIAATQCAASARGRGREAARRVASTAGTG